MKTLRSILAGLCILCALSLGIYIGWLFSTTPIQIHMTNFDAYRTESVNILREEESGFFQIGVAVLGALWGTLVVSKDNRLRGSDRPEILMFGATCVLLFGFLWFNLSYGRLMAQLYWDMGPLLSN